jgi:hypothetical protein
MVLKAIHPQEARKAVGEKAKTVVEELKDMKPTDGCQEGRGWCEKMLTLCPRHTIRRRYAGGIIKSLLLRNAAIFWFALVPFLLGLLCLR